MESGVNAKSQSQSADFEQLTDLTENHIVYNEHSFNL